jgi:hypothetical protein
MGKFNKDICKVLSKYCIYSCKELELGLNITKSIDNLMVAVNLSLELNLSLADTCMKLKNYGVKTHV